MPLLYDTVALGMGAYTRAVFRVRTFGAQGFRLRPGTLICVTHRRETDVPLVCPSLYLSGRMWADRRRRIAFAAREDLHEPGFFAGLPEGLPPRLRRLLFPIAIGDVLAGTLLVLPIRSASVVRLNDVLRQVPELELDVLPPAAAGAFRARAVECGLPPPLRGGDVVRGDYADLLWRTYAREELNGAPLEPVWSRRAALAASDFRRLVELVRAGGVLMLFPEGRPSPDGAVGPLQAGLVALVRRARPRWIQPLGIAYDPLSAGRTRAYVNLAPALETPTDDIEETVLASMRMAVPVTVGQVVARGLELGRHDPAELARDLASELEGGRAFEPELRDPAVGARRIREALAEAQRRPDAVAMLARELESVKTI